jgi:hypothetical protein
MRHMFDIPLSEDHVREIAEFQIEQKSKEGG